MRHTIAGRLREPRKPERTTLRLLELESRETPASGGFTSLDAAFGTAPIATVLRPNGSVLARIVAYNAGFRGGVTTAVNEIDGNANTIELVTGAGRGGGPHVKVFTINTQNGAAGLLAEFMAYETTFRGGVNVAAGNLNGDVNRAAVATAPGVGGGPVVKAFTIANRTATPIPRRIGNFFAFDPAFRGGATVAVGEFDNLGSNGDELAVGAGPGGSPQVRVFTSNGNQIANFFAFDPAFRGGVTFAPTPPNGLLTVNAGSGAVGTTQFALNANGSATAYVITPFGGNPFLSPAQVFNGVGAFNTNPFALPTPTFFGPFLP